MNVCGLWQATHRLAAAIANEDGTLRPPITTPATPEHIGHLLDYLVTAGIDTLILAERSHCLIAQARDRALHLRLVPHDLLEAIRQATALNHRPARHTASLLAGPSPPRCACTCATFAPPRPKKINSHSSERSAQIAPPSHIRPPGDAIRDNTRQLQRFIAKRSR